MISTRAPAHRFASPNRLRGIEPAHLRHLNVHEDNVELPSGDCGHRRDAIVHDGDDVPIAPEQPGRQCLIDRVVFGEQDPQVAVSHCSDHSWSSTAGRMAWRRRDCGADAERRGVRSDGVALTGTCAVPPSERRQISAVYPGGGVYVVDVSTVNLRYSENSATPGIVILADDRPDGLGSG